MSDEPFGRQPQPVKVTFTGEAEDIDSCIQRFLAVSDQVFWETTRIENVITIYPRAVND